MSSNAGLQLLPAASDQVLRYSGIAGLSMLSWIMAMIAVRGWETLECSSLGPLGPLTRGIMVRFSRLKSLFYPKSIYCLLFAVALLGAASLRACSVRC